MNLSSQFSGIVVPIITGYAVERAHSFTAAFYIAAAYLLLGMLAYVRDRTQQIC